MDFLIFFECILTGRKSKDPTRQLGAVVVFGAWLPMSYNFQHKHPESVKNEKGIHKILQVYSISFGYRIAHIVFKMGFLCYIIESLFIISFKDPWRGRPNHSLPLRKNCS